MPWRQNMYISNVVQSSAGEAGEAGESEETGGWRDWSSREALRAKWRHSASAGVGDTFVSQPSLVAVNVLFSASNKSKI